MKSFIKRLSPGGKLYLSGSVLCGAGTAFYSFGAALIVLGALSIALALIEERR